MRGQIIKKHIMAYILSYYSFVEITPIYFPNCNTLIQAWTCRRTYE